MIDRKLKQADRRAVDVVEALQDVESIIVDTIDVLMTNKALQTHYTIDGMIELQVYRRAMQELFNKLYGNIL